MDIDVQPVAGLHLQGGLHTGLRENGNRRVTPVDSLLEAAANL